MASPHVPRTVPEIVACASTCIEAGAAIVHHHNDEGLLEGRHASTPYRQAWVAISERHREVVLYPTMGGGGAHTNIQERYAHVEELADAGVLRLALIDPGSVSLGPLDADGSAGSHRSRLPEHLRRRSLRGGCLPRPRRWRAHLDLRAWNITQKGRFSGANREGEFLDAFRLSCLPGSRDIVESQPAGPCASYPMNATRTEEPFTNGAVIALS